MSSCEKKQAADLLSNIWLRRAGSKGSYSLREGSNSPMHLKQTPSTLLGPRISSGSWQEEASGSWSSILNTRLKESSCLLWINIDTLLSSVSHLLVNSVRRRREENHTATAPPAGSQQRTPGVFISTDGDEKFRYQLNQLQGRAGKESLKRSVSSLCLNSQEREMLVLSLDVKPLRNRKISSSQWKWSPAYSSLSTTETTAAHFTKHIDFKSV